MMLADVQAAPDDRNLPVDEVGITGIRYPIAVVDREHGKQDTIAEVSMSVDLPPGVKGAHLSRFVEVLHESAGAFSPQTIPAILACPSCTPTGHERPARTVLPVLPTPRCSCHRRSRTYGVPGLAGR